MDLCVDDQIISVSFKVLYYNLTAIFSLWSRIEICSNALKPIVSLLIHVLKKI